MGQYWWRWTDGAWSDKNFRWDRGNVNLVFSSEKTSPSDFSAKYCWIVTSILSGASNTGASQVDILPNTIPSAPPITEQIIKDTWPTTPDLSKTSPSKTNVQLNYGDGIILQHANPTYSCYLAKSTFDGSGCTYIFGSTTAPLENPENPNSNIAKIIIEPGLYIGQPTTRIDSLAGQPVRSGDMVQFEFVSQPGYTPLYWYDGGTWRAQIATPYPTYVGMFLWAGAGLGNPWGGSLLRMYKKGASLGDIINKNDTVYFVGWSNRGTSMTFLGSSGKPWLNGMEVYWVQTTTPNANDITWNITEIYPQAITSIQNTQPPGPWACGNDTPTAGAWLTPNIGQVIIR